MLNKFVLIVVSLTMSFSILANSAELPYIKMDQFKFDEGQFRYKTTIEEFTVKDQEKNTVANLVTLSYVKFAEEREQIDRPVVFIFNGGPVASSAYLHLGFFAPQRLAFADDTNDQTSIKLVENNYSFLKEADLVFIDPPGTGFSLYLNGVESKKYNNVMDDANFVAQNIQNWLLRHKRTTSPVYVFGESYGTIRGPIVVSKLAKFDVPVKVERLILFGQAVNIIEYAQRPENIISHTISLPTLAATAAYHGKSNLKNLPLEKFLAEVKAFASGDYLAALYKGNAITKGELNSVAKRLEVYTGIPKAYFIKNRLKITKNQFKKELLKDNGEVLGTSDARYKLKLTDIKEKGDPASFLGNEIGNAFVKYLNKSIGFETAQKYNLVYRVENGINGWGWNDSTPFSHFQYSKFITEAMENNPEFKLFIGSGYYDFMTTVGSADYLVAQSNWDSSRVTNKYYKGGHMAYTNSESAQKLFEDLVSFISEK